MIFSSLLFLFRFLPIVLLLYFLVPRKLKNTVLFVASIIFYAWGEPVYICLMMFSTAFNYFLGLILDKQKKRENKQGMKLVVLAAVVVNLAILGFFKYAGFVVDNIEAIFKIQMDFKSLALPIGISFYTFQTMSYIIDVYRGDAKVQRNFISFGTYVALFPQLIAGPIVRYNTIAEQLDDRKETFEGFSSGVVRFAIGVGKKVLLANSIGMLWDSILAGNIAETPALTAWLGALAYTFQIYYDFSGYSDMAIGLGRMFGFEFLENFNHPYESKSITEFWRRWHISLGTWFREYVYYPLGGNRCSVPKHLRNMLVVWALTGIWHGASWNFVIWGLYFGILLIVEKYFLAKFLEKLPGFIQVFYAFVLVVISWVIFACPDMGTAFEYMRAMFGGFGNGFADTNSIYLMCSYGVLFVLLIIGSVSIPVKVGSYIMDKCKDKPVVATILQNAFVIIIMVLSVAYLVNASYNPFLYFRF